MFKVNNNDTRGSIVNFEYGNASWDRFRTNVPLCVIVYQYYKVQERKSGKHL